MWYAHKIHLKNSKSATFSDCFRLRKAHTQKNEEETIYSPNIKRCCNSFTPYGVGAFLSHHKKTIERPIENKYNNSYESVCVFVFCVYIMSTHECRCVSFSCYRYYIVSCGVVSCVCVCVRTNHVYWCRIELIIQCEIFLLENDFEWICVRIMIDRNWN